MPGCRAPHLWLADGGSLYDALGPNYTLLRFDPQADTASLVEAARRRGLPLHVVDVEAEGARELYPHRLALVRPDQHIAWRGDGCPPDPEALVDLLRGVTIGAARKAA